MPNDAITLYNLVGELKGQLIDGKIDKVNMPENDEITLTIRAKGKNNILVMSSNPTLPRCHLTDVKKMNDLTAPTFLMILRKHLVGGIIEEISLLNNDRIVALKISKRNELKDFKTYFLICELLGRFSNIILTEEDFTIVDVIKKIYVEVNSERPLLPRCKYSFPSKNKVDFCDLEKVDGSVSDIESLLGSVSGLSKDSAKELMLLSQKENSTIKTALEYFVNAIPNGNFKPCLSIKNEMFQEFFIFPYASLDCEFKHFPTLSHAIDALFRENDGNIRKTNKTRDILQATKRYRKKLERRLGDNNLRLEEAANKEQFRLFGELIISYIYQVKKGDKVLNCINYYNGEDIAVPLDINLFPADNANLYYKKYNKLKNAETFATKDIIRLNNEIYYLDSIEQAVTNCITEQEFVEIREELFHLGVLSKSYKSKKAKTVSAPIKLTVGDFKVYIGKNNSQNNDITFNIANGTDIWLHTKNYHGSHGIIITEGKTVPEKILEKIASFVAFYSSAKNLENAEVDYTQRKNVKKAEALGLVHYQNYKTIYVKPLKPQFD